MGGQQAVTCLIRSEFVPDLILLRPRSPIIVENTASLIQGLSIPSLHSLIGEQYHCFEVTLRRLRRVSFFEAAESPSQPMVPTTSARKLKAPWVSWRAGLGSISS